jgi:type II secretory pathway pseudopilin PulG
MGESRIEMNLRPDISHVGAARRKAAFTMVEIAIALGVIAFALVAIIGILPTGLQTQRDNREETLVNQDARLLIEAIKSGGRDVSSDIGSYVISVDGTDYSQQKGIPTTNLIQLLSDTNSHSIVMSSISGAIATRGNDLGFRYEIRSSVTTNYFDFHDTILSNQFNEVRLRFAWPVLPPGAATLVSSEANTYKVRTLISGWRTNGVFYAQQYYQPLTNWQNAP